MQPNPPYPQPPYPPQQPPAPDGGPGAARRILGKPWVRYTLVGLVAFGLGAAVGGTGKKDDDKQTAAAAASPQPAVTVTVTVTAPPADQAAPAQATSQAPPPAAPTPSPSAAKSETPAGATIPGDGTYIVGSDIQPGTYKSTGNSNCYWARLKDTSGDLDSILANNFSKGSITVTIAKSDKAFQSQSCNDWTKTN